MTSRRQFLTGLIAASAAGASPTLQSYPTPKTTGYGLVPDRQEGETMTYDPTAPHTANGHEVRWVPAECTWSFRMNGWNYTGRISRMLKGYQHVQMYRPLPNHQGTDTSR